MTLQFASPDSTEALMSLLSAPADPFVIAGGTDLLIAPGHLPAKGTLIDLTGLAALAEIGTDGDILSIGAGVRVARLARDPLVARLCPALARAADDFGSVQIRNRATIGGNVANGSPAADLTPALVASGARAVLLSPAGSKTLPVAGLLARRHLSGRREVITAFRIDGRLGGPLGAFAKLGRRREPAISRLTLAAAGRWGTLCLVAGAIGRTPRRLCLAEEALNADRGRFGAALEAEVLTAIPGRASAAYKSRAIRAVGQDLLSQIGPVNGARP